MSKFQRIWLWGVIIFSSIHYLRDTLQDLGIQNFLTTAFAKPGHSMTFLANPFSPYKIYWAIFNTYTISVTEIIFACFCLKRNKFGNLGRATLVIAVAVLFIWLFSWFFLK